MKQRYGYMAGAGEGMGGTPGFTAIYRYDQQTGCEETHNFGAENGCGEAVFVPRSAGAGEDEGHLMTFVYNAAEKWRRHRARTPRAASTIRTAAAGTVPGVEEGTALAAVATTGYFGFLAGPPLIGLVAEVSSLPIALGVVSAACGLIALYGGVVSRIARQ